MAQLQTPTDAGELSSQQSPKPSNPKNVTFISEKKKNIKTVDIHILFHNTSGQEDPRSFTKTMFYAYSLTSYYIMRLVKLLLHLLHIAISETFRSEQKRSGRSNWKEADGARSPVDASSAPSVHRSRSKCKSQLPNTAFISRRTALDATSQRSQFHAASVSRHERGG